MFLHEQEEEDRANCSSVSLPPVDIVIPLLTDMLEQCEDYDLKPFVTVVHIYPYIVGNDDLKSEEDSQEEEEEEDSSSSRYYSD